MTWKLIETAPADGTEVLGCRHEPDAPWLYKPTTVSFRTFHPNSPGKAAWRDATGHKVIVTHWREMPSPPPTSRKARSK